jgi:hypothetical protein
MKTDTRGVARRAATHARRERQLTTKRLAMHTYKVRTGNGTAVIIQADKCEKTPAGEETAFYFYGADGLVGYVAHPQIIERLDRNLSDAKVSAED